ATDIAGISTTVTTNFIIDKTPPTLTITSPQNGVATNQNVILEYTVSDALAPPENITLSGPASGVVYSSEGFYNVTVTAADWAGNRAEKTVRFVIDKTPPTTTYVLEGTQGIENWFGSSVQIYLQSADNLLSTATYYRINSAPWQEGDCFTLIEDGTYIVSFYSADSAGNVEQQKTFSVNIDKSPPQAILVDINSGSTYTNTTNVLLSLSASDSLSGLWQMQLSSDGVTWSDWNDWNTATTWKLNSGDGNKKVFFRVKDKAGNIGQVVYDTIILDTTPPTTSSAVSGTVGEGGWYISDTTFALGAVDLTSGINCIKYRINSAEWNTYIIPLALSEGVHFVEYYAEDLAGNIEQVRSITIYTDETPPNIEAVIESPSSAINGWYNSTVFTDLLASDKTSGVKEVKYSFDGSVWYTYSSELEFSPEGTLTVYYYAVDCAGLISTVKEKTIKIDRTPPETSSAVSGAVGLSSWYTSDAVIALAGNDAASGVKAVKYKINEEAWNNYIAPILLSEGRHIIQFYSVDQAGNEGAVTTISVNVDKTPPDIIAIAKSKEAPANSWYNSDVIISIVGSDTTSGLKEIKYSLDSSLWYTYSSELELSSDGIFTVYYFAIDNAGLASEIKEKIIRIDKTQPQTRKTIAGTKGENDWIISNAAVTFTANDKLSGTDKVFYSFDSTAFFEYIDEFVVDKEGTTTVYYYSTDLAGNQELVKSFTLRIDKTKPVVDAALVGTKGSTDWYASDVKIKLSGCDAVSGLDAIYYSLNGLIFAEYSAEIVIENEGASPLYYYAIDIAGIKSDVKQIIIKTDKTPPKTQLLISGIRGSNGYYISDVTISLLALDTYSGTEKIYCKIRNGSWFEYTEDFTLIEGSHTVRYYAVDNAGNRESVKEIAVKVDKTAPTTVINVTGESEKQISFTTDEEALTYCKINNQRWQIYDSPLIVAEEGNFIIRFYSVDLAGNREAIKSTAFQIDNTPPGFEITNITVINNTVIIEWSSASDNISYYILEIGNKTITLTQTNYTIDIDLVRNGNNKLQLAAVDNAGRKASEEIDLSPYLTLKSGAEAKIPLYLLLLLLVAVASLTILLLVFLHIRRKYGGSKK
ncbi:MAG: hypothetical protein AB1485_04435, partial [Candidatus Thermoplasmatota archaeon]